MNSFVQPTLLLDGAEDQFRLKRIQTFNWGTFAGIFTFEIPDEGYLFVGPSGSGKSTALDAHAALMTPPKWVDFNVAARETERSGKDRSVMTYIRGAWAQQTGDNGEYASQYLRTGTTWSAIAETYRNQQGRCVVLAQVLWVKGNSTTSTDAKRVYLLLDRPFDVSELEFFAESEFDVRRFKQSLSDATVCQEFSVYQEKFRHLLGIDNERALRLLHKTQSAKNLGDLNVFLRDFMLDAPETFGIADRLVSEFGELNAAHKAVVDARRQIETLAPAREEHIQMAADKLKQQDIVSIQTSVELYKEFRRRLLLIERIEEQEVESEGAKQKLVQLEETEDSEGERLRELQASKAGMGGNLLEQLQRERDQAEREKPQRLVKREQAKQACETMGWAMPDEVVWFVQRVEAAKQFVLKATELRQSIEVRKDELKDKKRNAEVKFASTAAEVKALQRQKSNLPARLLDLREAMANDLSIPAEKLPFVGELLEVKADAAAWQGAIERVMGGFARSILVDDKHYRTVSAYLNERNIGTRLAYFRVMPQTAGNKNPHALSLVRKLNIAQGPYAQWLGEELKVHFDMECADSMLAFSAATRAITKEGLVKHNSTRHEKNDRQSISDRSQWVIGFDNKSKLALYTETAQNLAVEIGELEADLSKVNTEEALQNTKFLQCQTLSNMSWTEVDVTSLVTRVTDLTKRIEDEAKARPDLALIDTKIVTQKGKYDKAVKARTDEVARKSAIDTELRKFEGQLERLDRLYPGSEKPPAFSAQLKGRYATISALKGECTLENIEMVSAAVDKALSSELSATDLRITNLTNSIKGRFQQFNRDFPAESGGLDATMASAEDYFGKLKRLETDGLPQYEQRFLDLLREQSDQNITLLSTKLGQERSAIRVRMELVNASLETAPFNPGTHLVIDIADKYLEEVRAFTQGLKEALSHTFSAEPQIAEQRFLVLAALVKRLGSQETVDKSWRSLVLDVRQHVEFVARELDSEKVEVEVYRSGAGKSGGQRQKLAATCLAAALRYQLGGQDRSLPSYSTVVLDEAFDKADAEFTAMAMNIFKTFGFQMIVATPMKSVMTLEPFIGGACYIHIKDRKKSAAIPIDYDTGTQRLKLTEELQHGEAAIA
jgi:uncharacterized protein YPO0396